jgi:hypothetical protein
MLIFAAGAAVAIGIVAATTLIGGGARVTGDTADERIASISELAAGGGGAAARAIAEAAGNDPEARVRQVALMSLRQLLGPKVRSAVEAGTRDPVADVRSAAAGTLALYDDDAAAARLAELARRDASLPVRLAALTAMGPMDAPEALVALVETTESGRTGAERVRAVKVLCGKYALSDRGLTPADGRRWLHAIETIKRAPGVRQAFEKLSRPLKHNPDHLIPQPKEH